MRGQALLLATLKVTKHFGKSAMPALGYVLLDGHVARVTDLYKHVEIRMPEQLHAGTAVALPASRVLALLADAKRAPVRFSNEPGSMLGVATVRSQTYGNIPGIPAGEMPLAPLPGHGAPCVLDPADFAKGGPVAKALACACLDPVRHHVNCVLFSGTVPEPSHRGGQVVGTDGHSLAAESLSRSPSGWGFTLAHEGATILRKLCDAAPPTRGLSLRRWDSVGSDGRKDGEWARFDADCGDGLAWSLTFRPGDPAKFPPYSQVETGKDAVPVLVQAEDLRVALKMSDRIAIWPDGSIVGWLLSKSGRATGDGIVCFADVYPDDEPAGAFQGSTIEQAIATAPKRGGIACYLATGPCRIGETVVMPLQDPDLPTEVRHVLAQSWRRASAVPQPIDPAGDRIDRLTKQERFDLRSMNGPQLRAHFEAIVAKERRALEEEQAASRAEQERAAQAVLPWGYPTAHLGPPTAEDMTRAKGYLQPAEPYARAVERALDFVVEEATAAAHLREIGYVREGPSQAHPHGRWADTLAPEERARVNAAGYIAHGGYVLVSEAELAALGEDRWYALLQAGNGERWVPPRSDGPKPQRISPNFWPAKWREATSAEYAAIIAERSAKAA